MLPPDPPEDLVEYLRGIKHIQLGPKLVELGYMYEDVNDFTHDIITAAKWRSRWQIATALPRSSS